jgi:hypothetical protein
MPSLPLSGGGLLGRPNDRTYGPPSPSLSRGTTLFVRRIIICGTIVEQVKCFRVSPSGESAPHRETGVLHPTKTLAALEEGSPGIWHANAQHVFATDRADHRVRTQFSVSRSLSVNRGLSNPHRPSSHRSDVALSRMNLPRQFAAPQSPLGHRDLSVIGRYGFQSLPLVSYAKRILVLSESSAICCGPSRSASL